MDKSLGCFERKRFGQYCRSCANTKNRIAYSSRSNTITPFYVAASGGFFREEGLEVELIQVSPRLGVMAVMNGEAKELGGVPARPNDFVDLRFVKELDESGFVKMLYKQR